MQSRYPLRTRREQIGVDIVDSSFHGYRGSSLLVFSGQYHFFLYFPDLKGRISSGLEGDSAIK